MNLAFFEPSRRLTFLLLLLTAGLNPAACSEEPGDAPLADVTDIGEDVGAEQDVGLIVPPSECAPPADLPLDPLKELGSTEPITTSQKHLTDIDFDVKSGLIFASGMPGLSIMAATDGAPINVGAYKKAKDHLQIISSALVAVTSRGKSGKQGNELKGAGLSFYDVADPANVKPIKLQNFNGALVPIEDASGMGYRAPHLYVLTHKGGIVVVDVGSGGDASIVAEVEGLGNPWQMVVEGNWGYVADNSKGLVAVDLSDPVVPVIQPAVNAGGGVQDVDISDGVLYTASGSGGVYAFSLDDPAKPAMLASASTAGAAISVSADEGYVWVTNQESVLVFDGSDPTQLTPLGVEDTPSWAMHVVAHGNRAYVADWKTVTVFEYLEGEVAADADVELSSLYFTGGDEVRFFAITNRGGADLVIHGLGADDPRFTVEVDKLTVAPGDHATVTLTFASDGEEVASQLCVATNDPDESVQNIELASSSSGSNVLIGEAAPDFLLTGLDGKQYTLSSMKGHPVVLCFFASW